MDRERRGNICKVCGEGIVQEIIKEKTFNYKGEKLMIDNYKVYKCSLCEESVVTPETFRNSERTIRDFHRRVDGLLISDDL